MLGVYEVSSAREKQTVASVGPYALNTLLYRAALSYSPSPRASPQNSTFRMRLRAASSSRA